MDLDSEGKGVGEELLPLMLLMLFLVGKGEPTEKVASLISLRAVSAGMTIATRAAQQTLDDLNMPFSLTLKWEIEQAIAEQAGMIAVRAGEVLKDRSREWAMAYSLTLGALIAFESHRKGARLAAVAGGARYKTFVRLRPVQEPRGHSALEGTTIPINESFVIGGVSCYGPGDPALPLSERINCGHGLKYGR